MPSYGKTTSSLYEQTCYLQLRNSCSGITANNQHSKSVRTRFPIHCTQRHYFAWLCLMAVVCMSYSSYSIKNKCYMVYRVNDSKLVSLG